jgi:starch-binding outer membrane protein, SusD/RagB family
MNTKIFKFSLLAAFLLVAIGSGTGCRKELLTALPENQLAEAVSFETPDRFLSLLNGIYSQCKQGNFLGSRYSVFTDVRGEEFLNETGNGVTGLQTWNHTVVESTNEVNYIWNAGYQTINSINIYLEGAQANSRNLGNDALLANYLGEARFIRALCYHSMVLIYCRPYTDGNGSNLGLPLRLKAERLAIDNDLARSTVAEVYAQILDDLNFAETNLPATPASATIRAHKNAAIALKARVYLGMGRYADALAEANKLVPAAAPFKSPTGVAHELQANVKTVFTNYTTTESIFSFPFTTNNLPGTQNALGYYYNPAPRGNGEYSLNKAGSGIVADSVGFAVSDDRRGLIIVHTNNKPYLNKFAAGPQSTDYGPMIRYAEVLLTAAESEARVNGVNQRAVDLLNAVRTRSKGSAYALTDFADADALVAAILKERRIEFLGEGLRNFDIMRLNNPFPAKANVAAIPSSSNTYIWPMPSGERQVNKLLQPNP